MKKVLIFLILAGILFSGGCKTKPANPDAKVFKEAYESLNGTTTDSGKTRLSVTIPSDNPVVFSSNEEILQLLTDGTGIIYFGFPECPWCRSIIETFLDVCKETGVTKVYYLNNRDERDERELAEDGSIKVTKEGTDAYKKILELMGDKASVYIGLEDETIRRIYFPTILTVKDGKILDVHVSALPDVKDPYLGLTDAQKETLAGIYRDMIGELYSCDIHTDGC